MMQTKKRNMTIRAVLSIIAVMIILFVGMGSVYSHFGGLGTGKCADTGEFSKYAALVSDITIPEQTQIVALGEATHGNKEFQKLRLDVFKILVEQYGVRAFALEGDFGGCEAVNRYIHGGEGTAAEAVSAIGFAIYRTDEMEALAEWMRSYNETAAAGADLCFYGFDMQRYAHSYEYLLEAAEKDGINTAELEEIWDREAATYAEDCTLKRRTEVLTAIKEKLPESDAKAIHYAEVLLQNTQLGQYVDSAAEYPARRDQMMAGNALWILQQEQERGNRCIFVSGHNGHVEQFGSYGQDSKVMGNLLADKLGDDYFVIGTDFYKTSCNLPKGAEGERMTHSFYSHDPLAKASRKCGFEISYLDFSAVPETSALRSAIDEYTWMGSLGEAYNPLIMSVLPASYRVWRAPSAVYDAMIFVTEASPTEIKPLTLQ